MGKKMKEFILDQIFEKPISGEWGNEATGEQQGVKVIRTTNFTNKGILNLTDVICRDIDIEKYENKILKNGDIIIEKSGGSPNQPVGRTVLFQEANGVYLCNNFTSILRPKGGFNSKYLLYMLMNLYQQRKVLRYQNKTTGIINLKLNDYLSSTRVVIPTIGEQDKIASILDKAQELINKRKEQIESFDELIKGLFYDLFGNVLNDNEYKKVKLKDTAIISSSKRIYANEYVERGIPFYRSKEIRELGENLRPSVELFISVEKYDSVKNKYGVPKKGDILIAAIGATIGYTWLVNTDEPFYYKDGNLLQVSINNSMDSIYLNYLLKILINDFKQKGASGTAQLALTIEKVEQMEVLCPPLELQNKFAEQVQKIEQQKQLMQQSLTELENNFNSLMQRAFKGELF